jgi:hypothetical protein
MVIDALREASPRTVPFRSRRRAADLSSIFDTSTNAKVDLPAR